MLALLSSYIHTVSVWGDEGMQIIMNIGSVNDGGGFLRLSHQYFRVSQGMVVCMHTTDFGPV